VSAAAIKAATLRDLMQRDLVLRASAGDHDAFASLATDAYGRLHRTARLILRRDDLASDAVQEALTSAWRHIRAVRDPDRFDAWLNRLLVRACYHELGRTRRAPLRIDVARIDLAGTHDATASVADRDQLQRGFERLSPEHRAALVVHHYLGLADAEAAAVLNVPVGTFKSRLNRGHIALRAALEAEDRVAVMGRESVA
jgi:RNA polymerase sigma-70 factor (ECF subfamily)